MKLLLIIVQDADARRLQDAFAENSVPFTRLASTGGFLRQENTTFFSGVEDDRVEAVKALVSAHCCARTKVLRTSRAEMFLRSTSPIFRS